MTRIVNNDTRPEADRARTGLENGAIAFFHSRMVKDGHVPPVPQLLDLPAFARELRATYPTQPARTV